MQISKFKDGRMVERWGSSYQLGMLQQIGAAAILNPELFARPLDVRGGTITVLGNLRVGRLSPGFPLLAGV